MFLHEKKQLLELNFKSFYRSSGVQKCIIGISGGIDSALTLAVAVNAVGEHNVHAILMPYKLDEVSSAENFFDAQEICDFFGVDFTIHHIDEFALPYQEIFPPDSMAFGNTLARIRMSILFGYANKENGIVLGTCNKSEVMLGYETKFGDGACDINILGNFWKTEVWDMATVYKIPEKFIEKAPSAELFSGHKDEDEMGFSYPDADIVLKKIDALQEKFSPNSELEEKIFSMWKSSAHKRDAIPTL